ncbi:MAG TPA: FGGY-family carbohydrate kinase [Spirochaetota bacterium]|nr:FGGY-family carbohydrate kinase [Spirochaetota bacterium]
MVKESSLYILAHDLGTTGNKSCIYRLGDAIELVDSSLVEYPLITTPDGGAEERADDWWNAVCLATRTIMERSGIRPAQIKGMAFCCQLQGSVMVDDNGTALRNPMVYLDGRATAQMERYLYNGILKIDKWNAYKTLRSLMVTGGLAGTAKDPLWKYHWVRENEPEIFRRVHRWIDVKDYLVHRATGNFAMTYDSAHLTWVFDTRPGKLEWSRSMCSMFDVDMRHLPPVIKSTDVAGKLSARAASEMGLEPGVPIFGGGGDTSLISIGSGCLDLYDTHVYIGTSGWVASNVDRRMVDVGNFIASILSAIPKSYLYVAEQETSGLCLQWFRDHLALDEIGVYLNARHICCDPGSVYESLYQFLNDVVAQTGPGAGNVIFTPWLHGNRSPREDAYARGMFFNLSLSTGKRQMVRSVLEGGAFHARWMLEAVERRVPRQYTLRFVGGGAKSDEWCQIMADVTGRKIETIENTQNAGTIGAAVVCAVGLGSIGSFAEAKALIPVKGVFSPREEYRKMYDRNFHVFKELYRRNKKLFKLLNDRDR